MLTAMITRWLARRGIRLITRNNPAFDFIPRNVEPEFQAACERCAPISTVPADAMYGLWRAVEYVVRCNIPGDFVECGVYRGGSTAMAVEAFRHFGDKTDRRFYLYDTFAGMTAPTQRDVDFAGRTPDQHLRTWGVKTIDGMANSPLDEVRANLLRTGLAADRFVFVQGKVEETIPGTVPPGPISILRLDTDWYESTRHELIHLFPRLVPGGVLIVDDYGFWKGSRDACDEYFREHNVRILLSRVDRMGTVVGIKP
ncbi:MAG: putative methyltransferase [Phycisphaerales bacterium]|nr:putative methyltransferase [Phycisphaerales bacterium]